MFWSHFQQQGLALWISTTQSLFERQDVQIIGTPLDLYVNKKKLISRKEVYYENVNFTAV